MEEIRQTEGKRRQNIILEERKHLLVSGVEEVTGFDEHYVHMHTVQGDLLVQGEELRVEKLSVESGELNIHGCITSMSYEEPPERTSFWSRVFG